MNDFRHRMKIQKKPKKSKMQYDPFISIRKNNYAVARSFIVKAIHMYKSAVSFFEPLSDEEKICRDEILKYIIDLEILEHGTYAERKEVIKKYGGNIS